MIDSPMRTIVADDERLARKQLRAFLGFEPGVEVVAESNNGQPAIDAVRTHKPDLLLLDIRMPALDGFQVLSKISPEEMPIVILMSAHPEFAVRAFETHVLDYLLKPFDGERLHRAIERAKVELQRSRDHNLTGRILDLLEATKPGPQQTDRRMIIRTEGRVIFLDTEDVDWIEAEANYVKLNVGKNSYLLREGIGRIAERLDPSRFVRIHRSTIVNVNRIKELQTCASGEHIAILKNGKELACSRSYRPGLQRLIGKGIH
jgi:two-component system, LytTR family, response regulator